jgi:hypothetical protein
MKKYGLFDSFSKEPLQEYEGDYTMMDKPPFVTIYRYTDPERGTTEATAHVHLDKGQSVKEIGELPSAPFDRRLPGAFS